MSPAKALGISVGSAAPMSAFKCRTRSTKTLMKIVISWATAISRVQTLGGQLRFDLVRFFDQVGVSISQLLGALKFSR